MNTNTNIINLLDVSEFSEDNLNVVKNFYNMYNPNNPEENAPSYGWDSAFPELFGADLPKEIRFKGFGLKPQSAVVYSQKYRAGGKTKKNKLLEILQNIERNGYKLKYPPAAWFEWSSTDYDVITGNSRGEIVLGSPFNIPNMIVALYEASDPSYTKEQVQDAIDSCGLRFNAIHDPAAPISKEDVKRTVTLQIVRWNDTNGDAGCAPTLDAITARVDYVCGEGVFQPNTKQGLILEIYNNFNPQNIVIAWSPSKNAAWTINDFMKDVKWVNTDTVIYMPISSETVSQAYKKAFALADLNPNKEIRIVLQTGTLTGFDFEKTYKDRLRTFITRFDEIVRTSITRFGNKTLDDTNIVIYGALPALKASHSITEGFFYNSKDKTFFQKNSEVSFGMEDEEEYNLDEAA